MVENDFPQRLKHLRLEARLTNEQLAKRAEVPESLISGLQNGYRRVGEYQARKIAAALQMQGEELEQFVLDAINTCTEKVLRRLLNYPSVLINLIAQQLIDAGISSDSIKSCSVATDASGHDVHLTLSNGKTAHLKTHLCV